MLANDVLTDAFNRVRGSVHQTVEGLDERQLAQRPGERANSIAWLVWHLARIQDDHIADIAGREQLWAAAGWADRFGLPFEPSATGYGMSSDDVARVRANAEQLLGYYDAVHDATLSYLNDLGDADYGKVVDESWNPPVTCAVRLVSVLSDCLQHAGQAAYVRGLLSAPQAPR